MFEQIQSLLPLHTRHSRFAAILLLLVGYALYYSWIYPTLALFNQENFYQESRGDVELDSGTLDVLILYPRFLYGPEQRWVVVQLYNNSENKIDYIELELVFDYSSSRLRMPTSILNSEIVDTKATFGSIEGGSYAYGRIPFSVFGLENRDYVNVIFYINRDGNHEYVRMHNYVEIFIDRQRGLTNMLLENLVFPPWGNLVIFFVVIMSCSLSEEKDNWKTIPDLWSFAGITITIKIILRSVGIILMFAGIVVGILVLLKIGLLIFISGVSLIVISKNKILKNKIAFPNILGNTKNKQKKNKKKEKKRKYDD